jgi:hypothetical protein
MNDEHQPNNGMYFLAGPVRQDYAQFYPVLTGGWELLGHETLDHRLAVLDCWEWVQAERVNTFIWLNIDSHKRGALVLLLVKVTWSNHVP